MSVKDLDGARSALLNAFVGFRDLYANKPYLYDETKLCKIAINLCQSISQDDMMHNLEIPQLIADLERRMLKNKVREIIQDLDAEDKISYDEILNRLDEDEEEEESEEKELTEPLFDYSDRD